MKEIDWEYFEGDDLDWQIHTPINEVDPQITACSNIALTLRRKEFERKLFKESGLDESTFDAVFDLAKKYAEGDTCQALYAVYVDLRALLDLVV
jgi:hypothetical protein